MLRAFIAIELEKKASIVNVDKHLSRLSLFLEKNSGNIAEFLAGSEKYRSLVMRVTKHHAAGSGSLELEMGVYEAGKTHYYLEDMTQEALRKAIKELEA